MPSFPNHQGAQQQATSNKQVCDDKLRGQPLATGQSFCT